MLVFLGYSCSMRLSRDLRATSSTRCDTGVSDLSRSDLPQFGR